jgi:hypothetical protein
METTLAYWYGIGQMLPPELGLLWLLLAVGAALNLIRPEKN